MVVTNEEKQEAMIRSVFAYIDKYEKDWEKNLQEQRKGMRQLADDIQVDCMTIIVNSALNPILEKVDKLLGSNEGK